jgi:glycyl-tRNA synthetase (class II)
MRSGKTVKPKDKYEIISELAKRRGYFWPSYEIYGGVSGFLTFGPLGALLKRRIEEKFRRFYLQPLAILEINVGDYARQRSGSLRARRKLQGTHS